MKGILLDENNDLRVLVKRDENGLITQGLVVGESKLQDAYIVLHIKQGELKEDPVLGINLIQPIRSVSNLEKIKKSIKIALQRANIDFDDIKNEIQLIINKESIKI